MEREEQGEEGEVRGVGRGQGEVDGEVILIGHRRGPGK